MLRRRIFLNNSRFHFAFFTTNFSCPNVVQPNSHRFCSTNKHHDESLNSNSKIPEKYQHHQQHHSMISNSNQDENKNNNSIILLDVVMKLLRNHPLHLDESLISESGATDLGFDVSSTLTSASSSSSTSLRSQLKRLKQEFGKENWNNENDDDHDEFLSACNLISKNISSTSSSAQELLQTAASILKITPTNWYRKQQHQQEHQNPSRKENCKRVKKAIDVLIEEARNLLTRQKSSSMRSSQQEAMNQRLDWTQVDALSDLLVSICGYRSPTPSESYFFHHHDNHQNNSTSKNYYNQREEENSNQSQNHHHHGFSRKINSLATVAEEVPLNCLIPIPKFLISKNRNSTEITKNSSSSSSSSCGIILTSESAFYEIISATDVTWILQTILEESHFCLKSSSEQSLAKLFSSCASLSHCFISSMISGSSEESESETVKKNEAAKNSDAQNEQEEEQEYNQDENVGVTKSKFRFVFQIRIVVFSFLVKNFLQATARWIELLFSSNRRRDGVHSAGFSSAEFCFG